MIIHSNVETEVIHSVITKAPTIPVINWPEITESEFSFLNNAGDIDVSLDVLTWTSPDRPMSISFLAAQAQVSSGAAENPFFILGTMDAATLNWPQENFTSQFTNLIGTADFIMGNFVPIRIIFDDGTVHISLDQRILILEP